MFDRWGGLVYRARFTVIAVMVAGLLALAGYGLSLNDHLSQSGWDDPGSESVAAAKLADGTFGRDTAGDVLVLYTAPEGSTVDDPAFSAKITDSLNSLVAEHPDEILKINGAYWPTDNAPSLPTLADPSRQHAIASIAIAGEDDTELTGNFREVKDAFYIDGVDVQLAGLQPISGALNDTMANDIKRMEILAIPAVGILLFFVFGGVVAAALPLITGGLTIVAANGIVRLITNFTEVNSFVAPVVSLIGLGLAIDYGLFMVSRFREELAEGYDTPAAVRRTVVTAGRTVVFSATMVVTSLGGLVLFPQGFLKSVAYGAISAVSLAALLSITILPAILSILGRRIDMFGMKRFGQIQSNEQVENSFLGRLCRWVMVNPMKVTIPTVIGLLLLIMPLTGIKFGGINETYLPPEHPTRVAQETFDELFPGQRAEPVKLVVRGAEGGDLNKIITTASEAPGLVEKFTITGPAKDGVRVLKAGLTDRNESADTIEYLHAADWPEGVEVLVGGTPAIEQDSIAALLDTLPLMVVVVVLLTTLLMFLAFGSLVLPVKAVLMSALGLGSTLGILTWIFIDGNGADLLNFTPGPIMSPVLVLIIAIVYGLSTDYEVFLLSRMVEARSMGASTTESIRIGTAHTGRIITAAALILIVVTGAFGFSDLVMMKYIAFGMIAALIIDATVIRMFLVPAVMKLLGDDCWWAPAWMKRIQEKIGLGEPILADELMPEDVPELITVGMFGPATVAATGAHRFPAGAFEGGSDLTQPLPKIAPPRPAAEQRKLRDLTPPPARRQVPGRPPVRPAAPASGRPPAAPRNGERVPPAAGRPTPASRPVQPGTGPGRPSRPVPEPRRRPEDRPQVDERNGSALPERRAPETPERRAPEVPQRDAAQRGPLDPTQRGPLDPTQRGPLDPTQRGPLDATQRGASDPSSPSSVPPLPRRRRGEVPPPLPQSFVRPPAVPGDAEALPGTQASRPGESGTGRARDPQAIENWLSQLRRTSPGGDSPAQRPRPASDAPRPSASDAPRPPAPGAQRSPAPESQRPQGPEAQRPPAQAPARPPAPSTQQPPTQGMQPPAQGVQPPAQGGPRPPLPSRSRGQEQPPRPAGERPEAPADESQPEQNDAESRSRGRHGPDSGRSISVSELIARQRRD
ncbi:MMPL family transporter [Rhodococcus rhodochrous]|uniref:MMPL family transporter n=1 Tax=Rhodococcus rhodochrous TaxID=1829 RepID=UPI001E54537F|nr:MMPL family transporter [Rhodococcus rhodochrous]MCB8910278.1 MMPL family transporter [Rhodococcus rhodochrous]